MPTTVKNPWSLAIVGVLAVAGGFFVVRHASDASNLAAGLGALDLRFAGFGLVVSCLAMLNRGLLNRASHRAVGLEAEAGAMTRTAAVGFAAQKMVKSAGAAGLAVFVRDGRRRGYAPGTVAAACVLSAVSSFVALGVLLLSAIGVLALTGRLTGWWVAAATGFGLYSTAVVVIGVALVRHRSATVRLWSRARRAWGRLTRRPPRGSADDVPGDVFAALDEAWTRPGSLGSLLLHGVASKMLGALMLVAAVASVGLPVSPAAAVVVYATALGASMVTIVPGGVGAVEGSTTALLVASGVSVASATLAVVLFRFFDLLMPVVSGAFAARGRFPSVPEPEAAAATEPLPEHVEPTPAPVLATAV